jgi:hypothetical protein
VLCLLQLIARKAGGKDVDEIAAVGSTMAKVADVLQNAAAGLLQIPNAHEVSLPGYADVVSVPGYTDVVSLPGYTDVVSLPGYTDVVSLPGYTDVVSLPGYTDVFQDIQDG